MLLLALCPCPATWGAVFDWPTTPAWSGTGPTSGNTQTVDYGYYANGSVSVSVFNSGETWNAGFPIVQTGAARTTTGGTASTVNGFQLYLNNASNVPTNFVHVTINFLYTGGANNISFNLWDVDFGAGIFTDKIANIVGTTALGATVQATTITPRVHRTGSRRRSQDVTGCSAGRSSTSTDPLTGSPLPASSVIGPVCQVQRAGVGRIIAKRRCFS